METHEEVTQKIRKLEFCNKTGLGLKDKLTIIVFLNKPSLIFKLPGHCTLAKKTCVSLTYCPFCPRHTAVIDSWPKSAHLPDNVFEAAWLQSLCTSSLAELTKTVPHLTVSLDCKVVYPHNRQTQQRH